MLVSLGTQTGNMGVSCTCVFLIFASRPLPPHEAALCGFLALGGGLFQTGLSALLWPVRPYEPERLALASLYLGLARLAGRTVSTGQAPPGTGKANAASDALAARQGDHSVGSVRYRALLDQGERIRICLLTLHSLRERVAELEPPAGLAGLLDEYFASSRTVLEATGEMLCSGRQWDGNSSPAREPTAQMERVLEAFRSLPKAGHPSVLMQDIEGQMDALARQLRVVFDLLPQAASPLSAAWRRRHGTGVRAES
jgi:hypothetical protein